ncbi:MAG: glycoside hydrolase family 3 N-terminal domain-containing protein [Fulvivirga sp.]
MRHKSCFFTLILAFWTQTLLAQDTPATQKIDPPFLSEGQTWVDSVFNTLGPSDKIAQLFMIRVGVNSGEDHKKAILELIQRYPVGGLVIFQGGPVKQAQLTNDYQTMSKVPLLIAIDAEWGLGMRLDSTVSFPHQMMLGATDNKERIYEMGRQVGKDLKRMGIHMNLAPVVDVNNNPKNPVISYRSFGENKIDVAEMSTAYMQGMQAEGVIAVAKHFPGHGDTETDSHADLPIINKSKKELDTLEIYPFKTLVNNGIGGVMSAHLHIPALDSTTNLPASLSRPIITGVLRNELGFKGLVVTDGMGMRGVSKHFTPGEAALKALSAGNDLVELSPDLPAAIKTVEAAVRSGRITQKEIDDKCRKILHAKYWAGLNHYEPVQLDNLIPDLNTPAHTVLNEQLTATALTVLKNKDNIIPLRRLDTLKIASLALGEADQTAFQDRLENYTAVDHYNLTLDDESKIDSIRNILSNYNLIVVGVHQLRSRPGNYDVYGPPFKALMNDLALSGKAIITFFRNPYTLSHFNDIHNSAGLIMAYQQTNETQDLAAQLIFGGIKAAGKLPVTVNEHFGYGTGIAINERFRLGYGTAGSVGMDQLYLEQNIDSLVGQALMVKAIPGAQILVAKDKKIIFHKAYGLQSYFDTVKVKTDDLYDLASVSKITTTLPVLMQLHDQGKFNLDATMRQYMPYFKGSNKADLSFREILAHQAALKPWIPYWRSTLRKNGTFKWFTFKHDRSKRFPIKVADDLYLHKNYKKKIYKAIKKSDLEPKKEYKYSGLAFYLFPKMIEEMTGQTFQDYLYNRFYIPLGATTLRYNPLQYFSINRIVPTEYDLEFRNTLIYGEVHDEGAAMMAGVSGNAGLFSNANDMAKLLQMYLNGGTYGGNTYISDSTMKKFESCQFCEQGNRRGLGFDKPAIDYIENGNTARDASPESFGHSGFTGTLVWVDPKYDLIYVFLSNRVHPTRENTRLYKLNTRTKIQQVLYDAVKPDQKKPIHGGHSHSSGIIDN